MVQEDLGTWLVRQGELTAERLEDVYEHQVTYGGALDTNLLEMSLMSEETLVNRLGQYLNLPIATRDMLVHAEPEKLKLFPQKLASKYGAVPFRIEGRNLSLALNHLPDLSTLDDIGFMLSVYIRPFAALEVRLQQAMLRLYGTPIAARHENLLAQLGEDPDEDRAFFTNRKTVATGLPATARDAGTAARRPVVKAPSTPPTPASTPPVVTSTLPPLPPAAVSAAPAAAVTPDGPPAEAWVAEEPARIVRAPTVPPANTSIPPPLPVEARDVPAHDQAEAAAAMLEASEADLQPTALSPLLSNDSEPPPVSPHDQVTAPPALTEDLPDADAPPLPLLMPEVDPVFDDPEATARIARRAEKVTWRLADARAEFALAQTRDDVVEVLLRFAYRALDYAAVFVLQGKQFTGWDSIGEGQVPRALSAARIVPAPGSALSLVEQTSSHYLGPLKPNDPLPNAVGRPHPRVALLVPFFMKGRLIGVLYGERGQKTLAPRAVSDLQALTPEVGRSLEALILKQKRLRMGFAEPQPAQAAPGIREALGEPAPTTFSTVPGAALAPAISSNATTPPTLESLALLTLEGVAPPPVAPEQPSSPPDMEPPALADLAPTALPPTEEMPAPAPSVEEPPPALPPTEEMPAPAPSSVEETPPALPPTEEMPAPAPSVDEEAAAASGSTNNVETLKLPRALLQRLSASITDLPTEEVVDEAPLPPPPAPPTDMATEEAHVAAPVAPEEPALLPPPAPPRAAAEDLLLDATPADWSSWQPLVPPPPVDAPASEAPPTDKPPPLPRRRATTDIHYSAPAKVQEGPRRMVDPAEANERHADELHKEAETAVAADLPRLVEALLRCLPDSHTDEHLLKAVGRSRDALTATEVLVAHKGLATAAALRNFPGQTQSNLFSEDSGPPNVREVSPLCRVLLRLGDTSVALAVAHGSLSSRREARYLAVLLAREVKHPAVAALVAGRVFDHETRVSLLAANTLDRMLLAKDERTAAAHDAVGILQAAMEHGTDEEKERAVRAAESVHDGKLVEPLIELVDDRNKDLAESALRSLLELTKQDFGNNPRKWRSWHKEHGKQRRMEWLVDALAHKERELRQSAQRELNQITGEYLGYYHDAPQKERDAAVARWRAWWEANKSRPELP